MARVTALAVLLLAAQGAPSPPAAPTRGRLGCYWYPREAAGPVTNRTLASIPASTCDYVDIAGPCLLKVTPEGRLSWAAQQPAVAALHQLGGSCAELAAATAEDARAAVRKTPHLRFYWSLSGTMATMKQVFNDSALRSALVSDLANFSRQHADVVHGFAFDYEVHYDTVPPDPHFCTHPSCLHDVKHGLTLLLSALKAKTGLGVNWWCGGLTWFANVAHVADVQPFIDNLELGSYFDPAPFNTSAAASWTAVDALGYKTLNPHIMNPNDTAILVDDYGYSRSQIVVGVGLSSFSFMRFPRSMLADCVATGFLLDWPTCNTSMFDAVYSSTPGSHSSIGGGGHLPYRWDEIAADVAAGRAEQGSSPLSFRPGYGEVQGGPWLFYPSASDPEVGELTFWNAPPALDEFVDQAARLDLGGLFTWTATSDALDWRVHTRLRKRLDAPGRRSERGVDGRVRTVTPRKNASVYPWHHVGGRYDARRPVATLAEHYDWSATT